MKKDRPIYHYSHSGTIPTFAAMSRRNSKKFPFSHEQLPRLLAWAMNFEHFSWLNGNGYSPPYGPFPNILFAGRRACLESSDDSLNKLENFLKQKKDWVYGYFSYDLKNEIEDLKSRHKATIPFPHLGFMVPEHIVFVKNHEILIESHDDPQEIYDEIMTAGTPSGSSSSSLITAPQSKMTKVDYIRNVLNIKESIVNGEFYEMNYCIEYHARSEHFDPLTTYLRLNEHSPMPFSVFMRTGSKFLISASPERFLKKNGTKLISQPIKGTIRRSFDKQEDEQLKTALRNSEKERAENLMIVDLVRNDLARSAMPGSVKVDELFGIYSFKTLHQMISTVTARMDEKWPVSHVIRHAFPMGSMTGAPKIRVMQEIDKLEDSGRGLYSGAVGFIDPHGDFDFNVVIRSIIHNAVTGDISFHVGSAVTYDADPEYEYHECLLKAGSIFRVLAD